MHLHLLSVLVTAGPCLAAATDCTRDFLQTSADSLVAAQTAGNPSLLKPISDSLVYHENYAAATFKAGILATALKIDHSRHSLDTTQCATYSELVSASGSKPRVVGVQMYFTGGAISKIDTLITSTGDWLFNATGTLQRTSQEDWGAIPEAKRDSRAVIQAAADAYLDAFKNGSTKGVPWGSPCARLEGGQYIQPCSVGIPSGVSLVDRHYVIDETVGAVDVFLSFAGIPDSHEFRVEGGKIRFVHTLTVMTAKGNGKGQGARKDRRMARPLR